MIPSLTSIVQTRLLIAALLKVVAVYLWINSLFSVVYLVTNSFGSSYHSLGDYLPSVITFVVTVAAGIALFAFATPLSCAFVPLRFLTTCPRCRYPLAGAREGRCPECGLGLPEELVSQLAKVAEDPSYAPSKSKRILSSLSVIGYIGMGISILVVVISLLAEWSSSSNNGYLGGGGLISAVVGSIMLLSFILLVQFSKRG